MNKLRSKFKNKFFLKSNNNNNNNNFIKDLQKYIIDNILNEDLCLKLNEYITSNYKYTNKYLNIGNKNIVLNEIKLPNIDINKIYKDYYIIKLNNNYNITTIIEDNIKYIYNNNIYNILIINNSKLCKEVIILLWNYYNNKLKLKYNKSYDIHYTEFYKENNTLMVNNTIKIDENSKLINSFCLEEDLLCVTKFDKIKILKKIGSGSFGFVYKANAYTYDKKIIDIAIKIYYPNEIDINSINKELEYSIIMGDYDLGPKIYDIFFKRSENDTSKLKQFILMECGDFSVDNYIDYKINRKEYDISDIFNKIKNILKKQIFELKFYCVDVKPQNCIYFINTQKVKMIDYDAKFCYENIVPLKDYPKKYKNEIAMIFYFMSLCMLFLCTIVQTDISYLSNKKYILKNIFKDIFNDNIFRNYSSNYNKLKEIFLGIILSEINLDMSDDKPAGMASLFLHYCSVSDYTILNNDEDYIFPKELYISKYDHNNPYSYNYKYIERYCNNLASYIYDLCN